MSNFESLFNFPCENPPLHGNWEGRLALIGETLRKILHRLKLKLEGETGCKIISCRLNTQFSLKLVETNCLMRNLRRAYLNWQRPEVTYLRCILIIFSKQKCKK